MSFLHGHAGLSTNHSAAYKSTLAPVDQSQRSVQVGRCVRRPITARLENISLLAPSRLSVASSISRYDKYIMIIN